MKQFAFDFEEQAVVEEEIKKKKKNEDKKEISKKGNDKSEQVELPVKVYGGPYTCLIEIDLKKKISLKELEDEIVRRFPELENLFKLEKINDGYKLSLSFKKSSLKEEIRSIRLGNEVDIVLPYIMTGKEAAKIFYQQYPEYIGCSFHVVEKYYIMIPFLNSNSEKRMYPNPVNIGFHRNSIECLDFEKDMVSEKEILDRYSHPEYSDGSLYYVESENLIIPLLKDTNNKEKEVLICLPVTVKTGAYDIVFTSEDLGKDKVTLEELRKGLEKQFSEYSKERTVMEYDSNHSVVAILRGSKKGVEIISTRQGYELIQSDGAVIEKRPYGIFQAKQTISFTYTGEKIPLQIYDDIIDLFRQTPCKERAVQVFLKSDGTFFLYDPVQTATESSVEIVRNKNMEDQYTFVLDVHSHGKYSAFFSSTDNQDEKGTRLYMVVGNLNENVHSIVLRAGMNGRYCDLKMNEIFETER